MKNDKFFTEFSAATRTPEFWWDFSVELIKLLPKEHSELAASKVLNKFIKNELTTEELCVVTRTMVDYLVHV